MFRRFRRFTRFRRFRGFRSSEHFKPAFTLIEMLVVIGIIAILIGASIGGYSAMTKSAEKARCQELVSNVATALTALFQEEGSWPRALAENGSTDGKLDEDVAKALVFNRRYGRKYFSLTTNGSKLGGHDRFGIVTPWAQAVIKRGGTKASKSSKVGSKTVDDHILHYALDLDGDGRIIGASVGGQSVNVRATAIVWCCGKDGEIDPYPSGKTDDVYSWTPAQTIDVQ